MAAKAVIVENKIMSESTGSDSQSTLPLTLFESGFIEELRPQIQQFSVLQLSAPYSVEDVVQEALACVVASG